MCINVAIPLPSLCCHTFANMVFGGSRLEWSHEQYKAGSALAYQGLVTSWPPHEKKLAPQGLVGHVGIDSEFEKCRFS